MSTKREGAHAISRRQDAVHTNRSGSLDDQARMIVEIMDSGASFLSARSNV